MTGARQIGHGARRRRSACAHALHVLRWPHRKKTLSTASVVQTTHAPSAPGGLMSSDDSNGTLIPANYPKPDVDPTEFRAMVTRDLRGEPWWRPNANRPTAEAELAGLPLGAFLVRPSSLACSLALTHVTGSAGSIGHGIIHYHGAELGYSLEDGQYAHRTVPQLLRSLPLRFDIGPAAADGSSTTFKLGSGSAPGSPTPGVTAQSSSSSRVSVSAPGAARPQLSSLSRDSFRQATPGNATPSKVQDKLKRIRAALNVMADDLGQRVERVRGAIDDPASNVHKLVPVASLFKAVRPDLERSQSILPSYQLAPPGQPPAHLDKLAQLKFLLHISAGDMATFVDAARTVIDDESAGPKQLQSVAEVLKSMAATFVY